MKIILMIILLHTVHSILPTDCNAQTWNEWFRQKRTQRRYLAKQITLLRVYMGYLREGYAIAGKGLTTMHNIKEGDFSLHRNFFGSLKTVNPEIAGVGRIAAILAMQAEVVSTIKRVNNFCQDNEFLTPEEIRYVAAVCSNMLYLSDVAMSELLAVIRPDKAEPEGFQMTDNERLIRINNLYDDSIDKHAFVQSFQNDVHQIAGEREREKNAIATLKKHNGF
jgi:hypothetical protein